MIGSYKYHMTDLITLSVAFTMHFGIPLDYNNIHPHVRYTSDNVVAGVYYNSVRRTSAYIGKVYTIDKDTSVEVVLATGYMYPVVPNVKLTHRNFFIAPLVDTVKGKVNTGVIIGTEFKF
jgi:hypothetical protein